MFRILITLIFTCSLSYADREVYPNEDDSFEKKLRADIMGSQYERVEHWIRQSTPEQLQTEYRGWSFLSRLIGGPRLGLTITESGSIFFSADDTMTYGGDPEKVLPLVNLMLDKGVNPDFSGPNVESTPLKHALRYQMPEVAKTLINRGATYTTEELLNWVTRYKITDNWLIEQILSEGHTLDTKIKDDSVSLATILSNQSDEGRKVANDSYYPWLDFAPMDQKPEQLTLLQDQFCRAIFKRSKAFDSWAKKYYGALQALAATSEDPNIPLLCKQEQKAILQLDFTTTQNPSIRSLQRQQWNLLIQAAKNDKATLIPLFTVYLDQLLKISGELLDEEHPQKVSHIWRNFNRIEMLMTIIDPDNPRFYSPHGLKIWTNKIAIVFCLNTLPVVNQSWNHKDPTNYFRVAKLSETTIPIIPTNVRYQVMVASGAVCWQGQRLEGGSSSPRLKGKGFTLDWEIKDGRTATLIPDQSKMRINKYKPGEWLVSSQTNKDESFQFIRGSRRLPYRDDLIAVQFASSIKPDTILFITDNWAMTQQRQREILTSESEHPEIQEMLHTNRTASNARIFSISVDSPWLPSFTTQSFGKCVVANPTLP